MIETKYEIKPTQDRPDGYHRVANVNIKGTVRSDQSGVVLDADVDNADRSIVSNLSENESTIEPDIAELSKEERLMAARKMMSETSAENISLNVGQVKRISKDVLIEKTQNGFIRYHIQHK